MTAMRRTADAVVQIARMSLAFGRVDRITFHEDGTTPESDTDHTVMLGLIACAFAAQHPEMGLDVGLVAQYALVHDLPEVYAGDTPTLRALDPDAAKAKADRENAAAYRISRETSALPWVADTLEVYEQREVPEARYVKAIDKVLPKLTHILNAGVSIGAGGMSIDEVEARYREQDEEIRGYAADFPQIFDLRAELIGDLLNTLRGGGRVAGKSEPHRVSPGSPDHAGSRERLDPLAATTLDAFAAEVRRQLVDALADGAEGDELRDAVVAGVATLLTCHWCSSAGMPPCACGEDDPGASS